MAKVFEFFGNLINPNKKEDKKKRDAEAARVAAEQEFAMRMAAEEAEKKRKAEAQKKKD